jgi:protein farnesyltransferase subunit beta
MQDDGEVDVRATYTVIAVCALLNLLTPQLTGGVAAYARRCQTFDGGFGGEPGAEAHGGYAFCALATLKILGAHEAKAADLVALERWVAARQMQFEGGFQGRANKLVDNCYSFWQGGTAAVLGHACGRGDAGIAWSAADAPRARAARAAKAAAAAEADDGSDVIEIDVSGGGGDGDGDGGGGGGGGAAGDPGDLRVDRRALQRYILLCGQQYPDGGLRDKPSKPRDFYHTCYALSGLSVAQHGLGDAPPCVWGDASNLLERVHPAFNVPLDKAHAALDHFGALPCDHEAWMAA